jgi:hypothetical protein
VLASQLDYRNQLYRCHHFDLKQRAYIHCTPGKFFGS